LQAALKPQRAGSSKPPISDWRALLAQQRKGTQTSAPISVDAALGMHRLKLAILSHNITQRILQIPILGRSFLLAVHFVSCTDALLYLWRSTHRLVFSTL
jgi:hypothetical protein